MQKTEIPVIPMDNASGRFESNHPDITASFELTVGYDMMTFYGTLIITRLCQIHFYISVLPVNEINLSIN